MMRPVVGDRGRRYEVRATGYPKPEQSVIGWTHTIDAAKRMSGAIRFAPGCTSTEIYDREENRSVLTRYDGDFAMKLHFSNEWLREKIASDPDVECEAGPSLEIEPMSYSFSITADTKADAKQKIADQFANIVNAQPTHKSDRDAAVACGQAFVDILVDPKEGDEEIYLSMSGSLGWRLLGEDFTSAGISINASLRRKIAT